MEYKIQLVHLTHKLRIPQINNTQRTITQTYAIHSMEVSSYRLITSTNNIKQALIWIQEHSEFDGPMKYSIASTAQGSFFVTIMNLIHK